MNSYGNDYGSVTQIRDVLRKIGLEWWFKVNTAAFCDETSLKSKAIGTTIHRIIQAHIEEEAFGVETDYPGEVQTAIKSFFKFKKEHPEIKLRRSEIKVVSHKYKYNGTLDCLADENKNLILFDWKSAECKVGTDKEVEKPTIYAESEYQATAYVKAYNEMQGFEAIRKAGILALAKDKVAYNYLTLSAEKMDEIFERVFIPCISIYYYQKENDKYVPKENKGFSRKSGSLPKGF